MRIQLCRFKKPAYLTGQIKPTSEVLFTEKSKPIYLLEKFILILISKRNISCVTFLERVLGGIMHTVTTPSLNSCSKRFHAVISCYILKYTPRETHESEIL